MNSRAARSAIIYLSHGNAAAASADPSERRRLLRQRVLKGALVAYSDRYCTLPCTVRDISAEGARLRSPNAAAVPDRFELIIELDGLEANCEVVWRKDEDIGVRFLGAPRKVKPRRDQVISVHVPSHRPTLRRKHQSSKSSGAVNAK